MLSLNWRTPGRALPLAWVTVRKDQLPGRMREIEGDLLTRVARLWPRSCHPILLADRGFGTRDLFDLLDGLHGDWIIRSQGTNPGGNSPRRLGAAASPGGSRCYAIYRFGMANPMAIRRIPAGW